MEFFSKIKVAIADIFIIFIGYLFYNQITIENYQFNTIFDLISRGSLTYFIVMFGIDLYVLLFEIAKRKNDTLKSDFSSIILFELMMMFNILMIIFNGTIKMKSIYGILLPILLCIHYHYRFFRESEDADFNGNLIDNIISVPSKFIKKCEILSSFDLVFMFQVLTTLWHFGKIYFLLTQ